MMRIQYTVNTIYVNVLNSRSVDIDLQLIISFSEARLINFSFYKFVNFSINNNHLIL